MSSLRTRLILGACISLTAIFIAAAIAVYVLMRASLLRQVDLSLAAEAQTLATLAEQDVSGVDVEVDAGKLPEFDSRQQHAHYFEMWSSAGESIARSPLLGESHLQHARAERRPRYELITLPNGQPGRAIYLEFEPRNEDVTKVRGASLQTVTLAVARDTRDLGAALTTLRWLLAGVSAAAVAAGVAVLAWVISRGMRPLNVLAHSIAKVGTSNLSDRIASDATPHELMPVVQRLNELLVRLEDAVVRERAFTADVAHELRTPLAGLSSMLDVATSRPRDPGESHTAMSKCLVAVRSMQSLVENLLLLARADAGRLASTGPTKAFGELFQECWEQHLPQAKQRGLEVHLSISTAAAEVGVDDALVRMTLNNLLTNAVTYCDPEGTVEIDANVEIATNSALTVRIANTASHLSRDQASRVFDRFWRADSARSATGVHCGLGLALCRKLVGVLGGAVTATIESGMFVTTLQMPAGNAVSIVPTPHPLGRVLVTHPTAD